MTTRAATPANETDACADQLAHRRARRLIGICGLKPHDLPDLRQELLLHVVRRSTRFDPARGTWPAFLTCLLSRKATSMIRHRNAKQRDFRRTIHAGLTQTLEEQSSDGASQERATQLRIDVQQLLPRLPAELRRVCEALKLGNVAEAVRSTGMSRSRIQRAVSKLRLRFAAAGLDGYL